MPPTLSSLEPARQTVHDMHLHNGLYIDVYITLLLQRVWPAPPSTRP